MKATSLVFGPPLAPHASSTQSSHCERSATLEQRLCLSSPRKNHDHCRSVLLVQTLCCMCAFLLSYHSFHQGRHVATLCTPFKQCICRYHTVEQIMVHNCVQCQSVRKFQTLKDKITHVPFNSLPHTIMSSNSAPAATNELSHNRAKKIGTFKLLQMLLYTR